MAGGIVLKLVVTACTTACVLFCFGVSSIRAGRDPVHGAPRRLPAGHLSGLASDPCHVSSPPLLMVLPVAFCLPAVVPPSGGTSICHDIDGPWTCPR